MITADADNRDAPAPRLRQFAAMHQLPPLHRRARHLAHPGVAGGAPMIAWRLRGCPALLPGGWMGVNLGPGETRITQTFSRPSVP